MEPPRFARNLVEAVQVGESQPVHLECRLLPASDPKMTIEWLVKCSVFGAGYVSGTMLYAEIVDVEVLVASVRHV